jgi:amino acid transporter
MPPFGVISQEARGHAVTTILIAMVAMLFTAVSYGRMAQAYPSAGSAFTYVGREISPALGYVTGWSMAMDYLLNPLLCIIWCSKAAMNILPGVPYSAWVVLFALLFTGLNLRGIRASARSNEALTAGMGVVILIFLGAVVRYLWRQPGLDSRAFAQPFYDPSTFSLPVVFTGTSIAALTYIGFDGISTLSEEAENPRRNVLLATVLTCLVTGVLATLEVYAAQLVWPDYRTYPDVDTAYVHVAGRAGGPWLFQLVNFTLLAATVGSGSGAHLAAARLLYGMGRDNAIPRSFFGVIEPKRGIPRNNVVFLGLAAMLGAFVLSYQLSAELLNFGAFIAFMGVNAAAFVHRLRGANGRRSAGLIPPVLGFAICGYIWLSLRRPAKIIGGLWLAVGVIYGAIRTRGFRKGLLSFGLPEE